MRKPSTPSEKTCSENLGWGPAAYIMADLALKAGQHGTILVYLGLCSISDRSRLLPRTESLNREQGIGVYMYGTTLVLLECVRRTFLCLRHQPK